MDGQEWRGLNWIVFWVRFENVGPPFFKFIDQFISKCHLHSWKIILSCYVVVILQIKGFCYDN